MHGFSDRAVTTKYAVFIWNLGLELNESHRVKNTRQRGYIIQKNLNVVGQ